MVCAQSTRVSTSHGIRKGDSAKKLSQFPRTSLKVVQNHYELQPTDSQDRGYIIWFEVQEGRISEICAARPTVHSYIMQGGI